MRKSETIIFSAFNLLLAFFPLTTLVSSNGFVLWQPITTEIQILIGLFASVFLINQLLYLLLRRKRIHILFYLLVVLLFAWRPVLMVVGDEYVMGFATYSVFFIVVFTGAAWASQNEKLNHGITAFLFVFALVPVVRIFVLLASGQPEMLSIAEHSPNSKIEQLQVGKNLISEPRPNVYLIIFDSMASTDQFVEYLDSSDETHRRIREFESSMSQLGYTHLRHSWSNYGRTFESMSSFFNLEYNISSVNQSSGPYGFIKSAMFEFFRNEQYAIVARQKRFPCPEEFDECFPTANQFEWVSILASLTPALYLLDRLDRYIFTPFGLTVLREGLSALKTMKLREVRQFIQYLDGLVPGNRPRFTYAHFMATHPVNYYDENCDTKSMALYQQVSGETRTGFSYGRYAAEYACFLRQIVDVAQAIERKDPDAWVFFFSDHGYGVFSYGAFSQDPWDKERFDSTFRIMNVIKAPLNCAQELARWKSNVNKAIAIVNCLSGGSKLSYLPELVDLYHLATSARFLIYEEHYERVP